VRAGREPIDKIQRKQTVENSERELESADLSIREQEEGEKKKTTGRGKNQGINVGLKRADEWIV